MEYCPHCMRPVSGDVCPHCGGQVHWDNSAGLLPVGTILSGAHYYQIGAAIGQGGFGITYIALDLTNQQRVAIKEYFPTRCAQRGMNGAVEPKPGQAEIYEGGRFSFLEEAQMLASLEGMPAVVQGLDYLETNNTAYLVMEFLDGTPLYQIVNQKGRILAEDLMPRLRPLLQDIGKLHARGIIHRDISPDNIMWMPDGSLKLLDFGCARSMEDGKSMTLLVKKGFAPLEQYQRHGQGPYTDVYALAATIYYCLTGIIPPESTERQLSGTPIQSPIALGAALTPEEENALMWGLELSPKTRPANMEVFSQRLFPVSTETPLSPPTTLLSETGQTGIPNSEPVQPVPGTEIIPPAPVPAYQQIPAKVIAICGAAAALALVLLIFAIVSITGSKSQKNSLDDPQPAETIETLQQSPTVETEPPTSAPEVAPTETTEPAPAVTEDGFLYLLEDGEATITGFTGSVSNGVLSMPDTIESVPVTVIGEGAFRDRTDIESIFFPLELRSIQSGAFQNCGNLRDIYLYTPVVSVSDCFDGCDHLRCAIIVEGVKGLLLPEDCVTYVHGIDTGAGTLECVWVLDDGVIYGITDQDVAVVMDIPADLEHLDTAKEVNGYPVTWLNAEAIQPGDAIVSLSIPDDLLIAPELTSTVLNLDWDLNTGSLACNWLFTCWIAQEINDLRQPGDPQIVPCRELVEAAMIRVEELPGSFQFGRPDGSSWGDLLDETGLAWSNAYQYIGKQEAGEDGTTALGRMLLEECVEAFAPADPDLDGAFYTMFGLAMIKPDGYYVDAIAAE